MSWRISSPDKDSSYLSLFTEFHECEPEKQSNLPYLSFDVNRTVGRFELDHPSAVADPALEVTIR